MGGATAVNGQDAGGFYTLVTDNNPADGGSDGTDKVYGAETLRFADQDVLSLTKWIETHRPVSLRWPADPEVC